MGAYEPTPPCDNRFAERTDGSAGRSTNRLSPSPSPGRVSPRAGSASRRKNKQAQSAISRMIRARAVTLLGPPGGDVGGLNGALAFRDGSSAAPADGHRGSPMTQRERHTPEGGAPATPALTAPPGAGLGCVWEDLLPSLPPARGRELPRAGRAAGGALRPPAPRRQRLRGPGRSRTPARRAARPPQRTDARPPSPPPDPDRLQRRRPRRRPARRRRPRACRRPTYA